MLFQKSQVEPNEHKNSEESSDPLASGASSEFELAGVLHVKQNPLRNGTLTES